MRQSTIRSRSQVPKAPAEEGLLTAASLKTQILAAVAEAKRCDPAECKKRIRALQLRWHPDKAAADVPALRELAGEVTKMLNEALAAEGGA